MGWGEPGGRSPAGTGWGGSGGVGRGRTAGRRVKGEGGVRGIGASAGRRRGVGRRRSAAARVPPGGKERRDDGLARVRAGGGGSARGASEGGGGRAPSGSRTCGGEDAHPLLMAGDEGERCAAGSEMTSAEPNGRRDRRRARIRATQLMRDRDFPLARQSVSVSAVWCSLRPATSDGAAELARAARHEPGPERPRGGAGLLQQPPRGEGALEEVLPRGARGDPPAFDPGRAQRAN